MSEVKIQSALISVFYKDGLDPIVEKLHEQGVKIYSTGGTQKFLEDKGIPVIPVEDVTAYPSIFGGRVKTLHPKIFGGILYRRGLESDEKEKEEYDVPAIDLVIVDLYPFEETVASGASEDDIIEKIDIGGIALIRGAAKNFQNVTIVSSRNYYANLLELLNEKGGVTSLADRKLFAARAFDTSSHYDSAIFNYMNREGDVPSLKVSAGDGKVLRYGENPHQKGVFYRRSGTRTPFAVFLLRVGPQGGQSEVHRHYGIPREQWLERSSGSGVRSPPRRPSPTLREPPIRPADWNPAGRGRVSNPA